LAPSTSGARTVSPGKLNVSTPEFVRFPCTLALQTAGDASQALPFGLTMDGLERWAVVYLGLSSLVFAGVWLVGYLRR
jgi:hypothetical protein